MARFLLRTDNSAAFLFIRVALGVVMFPHGAQKVFGWFGGGGYAKTMEVFTSQLHFLPILVILLMVTELLGSIGLVAGFLTRIWALGIGISMSICASMNHVQHGFFMNWFGKQQGEGIQFHLLVIGICLALVVGGGGAMSIDKRFSKRR